MVEARPSRASSRPSSASVASVLPAVALARRVRALTGAAMVLQRHGGWLLPVDGDGGGPLALTDPALAGLAPVRALVERRRVAAPGEPTALWALLARPHVAYPLLASDQALGVLLTADAMDAATRATIDDLVILGAAALQAGGTPDERPARALTQVAAAVATGAGRLDGLARVVGDAFGARGAARLLPDPALRLTVADRAGVNDAEAARLVADDAHWVYLQGEPRTLLLEAAGPLGTGRRPAGRRVLLVSVPAGGRALGVLALLEPAAERALDDAEITLARTIGALLAPAVVAATAAAAARAADARLGALLVGSRDSILVIDQRQTIVRLSPAARRRLRLADEAVGRPLATALRDIGIRRLDGQAAALDDLPLIVALRTGMPATADLWLQPAGGERGQVQCRAEPLHDAAGCVVGAVTIDRDVTREQRQERLHDALVTLTGLGAAGAEPIAVARGGAEQAALVLDLDMAALWLVDPTRQEVRWEAAHGLPVDHPPLAALPLTAPSLVTEAVRTATLQLIEEAPVTEAAGIAWRHACGCPADVSSALFVPLLARGTPIGVLALLTRQPRPFVDADLEAAQVLAAVLAVLLDGTRPAAPAGALTRHDDFVSLVSHELKTPLTSIKGYAELIARRLARDGHDARHLHALAVISQQAHRMGALLNDLLDLSRSEAGRLPLTSMPHDLGRLVERAVARCRERAPLPLVWHRPAQPTPVLADGERLEQAIGHLLSNAVRHSPDGSVVTVTLHQQADEAVVAVSDRGPGIAPDDQARLFERQPRSMAESGHLGLGLFIARQIALAHGGRLWVDSTPGQGSTFSLAVPLQRAP